MLCVGKNVEEMVEMVSLGGNGVSIEHSLFEMNGGKERQTTTTMNAHIHRYIPLEAREGYDLHLQHSSVHSLGSPDREGYEPSSTTFHLQTVSDPLPPQQYWPKPSLPSTAIFPNQRKCQRKSRVVTLHAASI